MEIEKILNAIQKEISSGNDQFFSYSWREKLGELGEFLQEESKYARLVDWINSELEQISAVKNVFCPADKDATTTIAMVNTYSELMKNLAILVHCRELLLDNRATPKMRENIEYTICKMYRIKYNEKLKIYV